MLWLALAIAPPGGLTTPDPEPLHVTGGQEVMTCGWPDTVAVTGGGGLCTGSLVHPRVVVYAAHCGDGDKTIRFNEDSNSGLSVGTDFCMTNPEYLGTTNQGQDWAFCVLTEEVTEIPVTPPLYGCGIDMIEAGQSVIIAGFGDSNMGSAGTKRWAQTQINSSLGNTANIGGDGTSTCQGDSGGSAFVAMDDGSWRAISMVSTGVGCGSAGVHALMHPAIAWIEEHSGYDITPCHDLDGTWHPSPACDGFFAGDETGYGTWSDWCEGTPRSGPATNCGEPWTAFEDLTAPTVTITSPMHAQVFDPGTEIDILIDAIDPAPEYGVRSVWVSIADMEQEQRDFGRPYGFPGVPFPEGVFTIVAFAEDWDGKIGESEPITIGIGQEVPPDAPGPGMDDGGTADDTAGDMDGSSDTGGGMGDAGTTGDDDGGTSGPGLDGGDDGGGGCSCRQSTPAPSLGLLMLLALVRRRPH